MTDIPHPFYERIEESGRLLALFVKQGNNPQKTTFLTEESLPFQAGYVVYPQGGEVVAHVHRPIARSLTATSEALIVKEGSCVVDIFGADRSLVATRRLFTGDMVLLYSGGHRIHMPDERCVLFEIKQGPYSGADEKERFQP